MERKRGAAGQDMMKDQRDLAIKIDLSTVTGRPGAKSRFQKRNRENEL